MHQQDDKDFGDTSRIIDGLQWRTALQALIRFGAQGEMIGVAHTVGGALIFITTERTREVGYSGARAFIVFPDFVVKEGSWTPDQDKEVVTVDWFGLEAQNYDMRAFRINPTCIPTPGRFLG